MVTPTTEESKQTARTAENLFDAARDAYDKITEGRDYAAAAREVVFKIVEDSQSDPETLNLSRAAYEVLSTALDRLEEGVAANDILYNAICHQTMRPASPVANKTARKGKAVRR